MRVSYRTLMAALIVAAGLVFSASMNRAQAQTQVVVTNSSPCPIEVVLTDGLNRNIFFIPVATMMNPTTTVTLSPGFTPTGVISAAGTTFNFVGGCTPCISLHDHATPTSTCCVVVCLNLSSTPATMSIIPCASPCNP